MTTEELITKQQLEIENFKAIRESNKKTLKDLHGKFYNIGAPLNDNRLQFNKEQLGWCFEVRDMIEAIDTIPYSDTHGEE